MKSLFNENVRDVAIRVFLSVSTGYNMLKDPLKYGFFTSISSVDYIEKRCSIFFQHRMPGQLLSSCFKSKDIREKVLLQVLHPYFFTSECVCK